MRSKVNSCVYGALRLVSVTLLISLFIIPNTICAESNPQIRVKEGAPPGFEELVRPQTTDVDVYYAGEKVGNTLATYTPESIELLDPHAISNMIPHLIDKDVIAKSLSGSLDTNAGHVCLSDLQRECGIITPSIAGVIFDENRFHLYVFVNQLQLQPQAITSTKFLPKVSSPKFSSVNSFASSISGEDNDASYTTGANHILSYGQSRLQTQWDYSDTRDFSVETLSLQNDRAGVAKEIGFYGSDTRFSSFTSDLDVLGARIYGSTSTRSDLDYSQSTEIFLFLNSRSQVEVFKDDKLIDGGFYEAGNQQLSTLRLPSGSYPIALRITDSAGNIREEQYFFVKTAILPPKDQPLHYFEVGLLEDDSSQENILEVSSSELMRIGTAYRLQNNLGASLEFLHSASTDLIQGGIAYFGPGYLVRNSAMIGSDDEWGFQVIGQYRHEKFTLNLDYRQVESNQDDDIDTRILPSDFSQGNISANLPLSKGTLVLRSQYNNKLNESSTLSYGLDYRYPLYRRNRYSIDLNISSFLEEDDYNIQSGLRISKIEPGRSFNVRPSYLARKSNGESEQGPQVFAGANKSYEHPNYGRFSISSFASEEIDRSAIGMRAENASSLGRADIQFEWVDDESRGDFTRFRGTQNTNVLSNGKQFALGGDRNSNSGVLIELNGQPLGEPFEIFVDGQPRGFAKVGKRTVLPLTAFQTYGIKIRSRSDELLNFDEGQKLVTLYPGNVQTLTYEVHPITVLITRILLQDRSPASQVRIDNAIGYAVTDDDGWLQAEISSDESLQISEKGSFLCSINLPLLQIENGVAFVDELRCSN